MVRRRSPVQFWALAHIKINPVRGYIFNKPMPKANCFTFVQDWKPQRCRRQARRGREHLVDLERSEQIYLVICVQFWALAPELDFLIKTLLAFLIWRRVKFLLEKERVFFFHGSVLQIFQQYSVASIQTRFCQNYFLGKGFNKTSVDFLEA